MNEYLEECGNEMIEGVVALQRDLGRVRTGRASLALLDGVRVDYYGTLSPLNQVAKLGVPEPRLIVVVPWDKSMLGPIEKAIMASDLGINPVNDGKVIRIPIPELTGERRKELVKQVGRMTEDAKVQIRRIRREYNDLFNTMSKDGELPEDDAKRAVDKVQQMTDDHTKQIDQIAKNKEEEILEV